MHSIGRNNMIIEKYFKLFFKNGLKKYDLNAAEGMVLLLLYEKQLMAKGNTFDGLQKNICGKTQDEMIEEIHFDKAMMTRTMQSLEQKGYVERSANPTDNRSFLFTLTVKAIEFKPRLLQILKSWSEGLQNDISATDLEVTNRVLSQMAQTAYLLTKGE